MNTNLSQFDEHGRFIICDYTTVPPFTSFLPGVAGVMGIPMWVFTVNRGQAITSMGIENKNNPLMEFQPANKAYRYTATTGFRTFIKFSDGQLFEPFAPWYQFDDTQRDMFIGLNELEIQENCPAHGLQTNVLYFILPGEKIAALVRQVTFSNLTSEPLSFEVLDGLPVLIPYGVDNWGLKEISRTLEAFMEVINHEAHIPFYRLPASAGDSAEVVTIESGHFALAFLNGDEQLLPALVDPETVFGQNTALNRPDHFHDLSLRALFNQKQITCGKTPCSFFGTPVRILPGESVTLTALYGHSSSLDVVKEYYPRFLSNSFIQQKRQEANILVSELTDVIATETASPLFDAYCRQTFLDNVLRGGWPLTLGSASMPFVYHVYSRKHGDPERDYNLFRIAAEMYSQGNGNYRDVNQNRRCDSLFKPAIAAFNLRYFLSLIQLDGYNPLVVEGSRFIVSAQHHNQIGKLVEHPDRIIPLLEHPFTPGQLLRAISEQHIGLKSTAEDFISVVLAHAEQQFEATAGEGYWIDHWFYNLDLIESYLAIYPDHKARMLFDDAALSYYDNPLVVQPRSRKTILVSEKVRQYGAVYEDEEKEHLITSRTETPNLMRTEHGKGEVYRTTVFAKLVALALIKFTTLDPLGMGIEMEAGKPGWYDALNGLPGLFGSSLSETYELQRLLTFLLDAIAEQGGQDVTLPLEQIELWRQTRQALEAWTNSKDTERDLIYWDAVATHREVYRELTRLGIEGQTKTLTHDELEAGLNTFLDKVQGGTRRAMKLNDGFTPTYFIYTVTDYEPLLDANSVSECDTEGRPIVRVKRFEVSILPPFLEGPVHALKVQPDQYSARRLHEQVKGSDLYDTKLKMFKVNASLADQSHEIGRARAFTPGWLENESIWLHMEYKYLLELLHTGLYDEFFEAFKDALIPFQAPEIYGRSLLENSSFLVSSAHPDETLHGRGFVARLSGATAEFLSMWQVMMVGKRPFIFQDGQLYLNFQPALPGWLFDNEEQISFMFLGKCKVTYHNPDKLNTYAEDVTIQRIVLFMEDGYEVPFSGAKIEAPHAALIRDGVVERIDCYF